MQVPQGSMFAILGVALLCSPDRETQDAFHLHFKAMTEGSHTPEEVVASIAQSISDGLRYGSWPGDPHAKARAVEEYDKRDASIARSVGRALNLLWQNQGTDGPVAALLEMNRLANDAPDGPDSDDLILMDNAIKAFKEACDLIGTSGEPHQQIQERQ